MRVKPILLLGLAIGLAKPLEAEETPFLEEASSSAATRQGTELDQKYRRSVQTRKKQEKGTAQAGEDLPPSEIKTRGIFWFREVRTESDWDCDPTAIPAWCRQFHLRVGLQAKWMNPRQPVELGSEEIFQIPFLYMTGHNAFTLSDLEVKNLRRYLLNGGALWIDDCLFGFPFGRSFKSEIRRVLPEYALEEVMPSKKGLASLFSMHYEVKTNESGVPHSGMAFYRQGVPPQVLLIEGRVAIVYTAYDLGCYAEISSPPTAANPIGGPMHSMDQADREGSYRLSTNIVLFLMTH